MNRLIDHVRSFFGVARDNAVGPRRRRYVVYARPPWVRNDPSANVAATVGRGVHVVAAAVVAAAEKAAAAEGATFSAEQVPQTLPPMQYPLWSARGYADRLYGPRLHRELPEGRLARAEEREGEEVGNVASSVAERVVAEEVRL